jgi:uncharacterized protein YndB with AHSA1/START domain
VTPGYAVKHAVDDRGFAAELVIRAAPDRVFDALTSREGIVGWWASSVQGLTNTPGDEMVHGFSGLDEEIRLRVDVAKRASLVGWTCISHSGLPEWRNTRMEFEFRNAANGTTLLCFQHAGLLPVLVCCDECESVWNHFLASLVAYAETGTGAPFAAV